MDSALDILHLFTQSVPNPNLEVEGYGESSPLIFAIESGYCSLYLADPALSTSL